MGCNEAVENFNTLARARHKLSPSMRHSDGSDKDEGE